MKIEPKRVKKIDSPLLIIGLGGTGSDALLTIMNKFNHRYELPVTTNGDVLDTPERTAYLAFDTDVLELKSKKMGDMSFRPEHIFQLTIPARLGVGALPEYITDWWDNKITGYEIKNGAGGIRQAGRFVLFHNVDAIVDKLKTVIGTLLATPAGGTMGTLEIVLNTGISGGTGSGTFLDMAYLIRYVMERDYPNVDYNFMAYILMPPVNVDKIPQITTHKRNMLEATGFAALKELDFWMNYPTHHYHFEQQYSASIKKEWNSKPFDNAVLMGNAKLDGTLIVNAYDNCLDVLSESVVNFFAHEDTGTNGQISLRSHLSNVTMQGNFLQKPFPSNYTYMTVGAAVSDSQQEAMVTYETKLTFDRIHDLEKVDKLQIDGSRHAAPLLGQRAGTEFMDRFLPTNVDYFSGFASVCPDLDIFSDPSWTPRTVFESEPIHGTWYQSWQHDCQLEAKKYAYDEVKQLYTRFQDLVKEYATNLNYGPYTLSEFLKDPTDGFAHLINEQVDLWDHHASSIRSELDNTFTHVQTNLYSRMQSINKLKQALDMMGEAKKYFDGCRTLFQVERDYELANAMSLELHDLKKAVSAYYDTILPSFCGLLSNAGLSLQKDVQELDTQISTGDIATVNQLKSYINTAFGNPQQDQQAVRVISRMIDLSQTIRVNNMGTLEGMTEAREQLLHAADRFVLESAQNINGINMDHLVEITMPDSTQQERIDYIAQTILPKLKTSAQTMLPLIVTTAAADQYIPYAYVSVPNNAPLIDKGVEAYQKEEHITPKKSDVSDKIYWLNTFNCVPLYMYTDLARLERVYDEASARNGVNGLHLVQATTESGDHMLRHDWSLLPSPVVHQLEKLEMPAVIAAKHAEIMETLEQALQNHAAALSTTPSGQEQLQLRLRMTADGRPETMDQFDRKLNAIVQNTAMSAEEKIEKLKTMADEGTVISKEYSSYTQKFAEAAGLRLGIDHGDEAEMKRVADNTEKARLLAAEYILYAWYPHLAEQMIAQKEMFRKLSEAIANEQKSIQGAAGLQSFAKTFLLLYLNGTFIFGRTSVKYKDFRGEEAPLINKADLTDDELTVYNDFCAPLVLLSVLGTETDARIDEHDRLYLNDTAKKLEASIDNMSDEEYEALRSKAAEFRSQYAQTADAIKYSKGDLAKPVRENMIQLLQLMLSAARIYA